MLLPFARFHQSCLLRFISLDGMLVFFYLGARFLELFGGISVRLGKLPEEAHSAHAFVKIGCREEEQHPIGAFGAATHSDYALFVRLTPTFLFVPKMCCLRG